MSTSSRKSLRSFTLSRVLHVCVTANLAIVGETQARDVVDLDAASDSVGGRQSMLGKCYEYIYASHTGLVYDENEASGAPRIAIRTLTRSLNSVRWLYLESLEVSWRGPSLAVRDIHFSEATVQRRELGVSGYERIVSSGSTLTIKTQTAFALQARGTPASDTKE